MRTVKINNENIPFDTLRFKEGSVYYLKDGCVILKASIENYRKYCRYQPIF